jgi:prophage regulatory protein
MKNLTNHKTNEFREYVRMKMLREKQVKDLTGLSRVTRWRMETRGEFPHKIKLSQRCVGWNEADILQWLEQRMEAR